MTRSGTRGIGRPSRVRSVVRHAPCNGSSRSSGIRRAGERVGLDFYSRAADPWTQLEHLPVTVSFMGAVAFGGAVYAVGGPVDLIDSTYWQSVREYSRDECRRRNLAHVLPRTGDVCQGSAGVDGGRSPVAVRDTLLGALAERRWQHQVFHRHSGEFEIFVAADGRQHLRIWASRQRVNWQGDRSFKTECLLRRSLHA